MTDNGKPGESRGRKANGSKVTHVTMIARPPKRNPEGLVLGPGVFTRLFIFGGNGYSQEWADEAERRGLSNHKTTPVALKADIAEKTISLYEELEVMNRIGMYPLASKYLRSVVAPFDEMFPIASEISRTVGE